jgi:endonuclease V-like protein UPF0215 family
MKNQITNTLFKNANFAEIIKSMKSSFNRNVLRAKCLNIARNYLQVWHRNKIIIVCISILLLLLEAHCTIQIVPEVLKTEHTKTNSLIDTIKL